MKKQQRLVMRTVILLLLLAALGYTIYANFSLRKRRSLSVQQRPILCCLTLKGVNIASQTIEAKASF